MNKRSFLTLTAGAVLAARSAVSAQQSAAIRVGTLITDSAAEPFYGTDNGMFAQAGLNVEVQPFTNYGSLQGALAGKAIDIGILDTLATAVGVSHGIPFKILAPVSLQTSAATMLLCVSKTSSLRSGRELQGKTIGVASLGGSAEVVLRTYLAKQGVEQTKVRLIEIPLYEMAAALERGTVDAAEIFEPALTVAMRAGIRPLGRVYDAVGPRFYVNAWVTTADYAEANTPVLKRLVATIYKVAAWANQHGTASGAILMKYSKLDPTVVATMTRSQYSTSFEPTLLQPLLDAGARFGMLPSPVNGATLIAPGFR